MGENLERMAEMMHEVWIAAMRKAGRHPFGECGQSEFAMQYDPCYRCHSGMVPWAEVPEDVKDINRNAARKWCTYVGFPPNAEPEEGFVATVIEAVRAHARGTGYAYFACEHCKEVLCALGVKK